MRGIDSFIETVKPVTVSINRSVSLSGYPGILAELLLTGVGDYPDFLRGLKKPTCV